MTLRIRKNATNKIKKIADAIKFVEICCLDNGFKGEKIKVEDLYCVKKQGSVFHWLIDELNNRAKLDFGEESGCLHVHSNLWFDLIA